MTKTCQRCGAEYRTENPGKRKFCGLSCCHAKQRETSSPTAFKPGSVPWNRGLKGIHLSPGSEFKKGQRPAKTAAVGAVTFRNDKSGKPRAWVKVAEPNKWRPRAQVVWERAGRCLRDGQILHHKNKNSLDDRLSNLQALTRAQHIEAHRHDLKAAA